MTSFNSIKHAAKTVKKGGIIAYPTEAVFGLGCDPDNEIAINTLLHLKQRTADKGLILLASDYAQLLPYVDDELLKKTLGKVKYNSIIVRWPDAVTLLLPAKNNISTLLTGIFDTIAVRITDHPDVVVLCQEMGKAIISTSANISNQPPAKTWQQAEKQFQHTVDFIIKGETSGLMKPSVIMNPLTQEIIRL